MALSKEVKLELLTNATVTYNNSSAFTTEVDTTSTIQLAVEVLLTYGANTKAARLDVYGSLDNTNYSTTPIASYDLVLAASTTTRQEFGVTNFPKYVKFKVVNNETTDISLTAVYVFAQRQIVS